MFILSDTYQLESLARFLLVPIALTSSVRDAEVGGSNPLAPIHFAGSVPVSFLVPAACS